MKRVKGHIFVPYEFTCPTCSATFKVESPDEFSLKYDEGAPFLMVECPECLRNGAAVRLNEHDEAFYLPFVMKAQNSVGPKIVRNVRLSKTIRAYCPHCLTTFELTTLNGIYPDHDQFFIHCPNADCGGPVPLNKGESMQIISEALIGF